jgi:hypothetical protein
MVRGRFVAVLRHAIFWIILKLMSANSNPNLHRLQETRQRPTPPGLSHAGRISLLCQTDECPQSGALGVILETLTQVFSNHCQLRPFIPIAEGHQHQIGLCLPSFDYSHTAMWVGTSPSISPRTRVRRDKSKSPPMIPARSLITSDMLDEYKAPGNGGKV